MHFALTHEQELLVETVRKFVETELYPHEDLVAHAVTDRGLLLEGLVRRRRQRPYSQRVSLPSTRVRCSRGLGLKSWYGSLTPELSCEGAGLELWMTVERCAPSSASATR